MVKKIKYQDLKECKGNSKKLRDHKTKNLSFIFYKKLNIQLILLKHYSLSDKILII